MMTTDEGESKMKNIKTLIESEFDAFFEFETDNRDVVTSTSAKLFAEHVVGVATAPETPAVQGEPVAYLRRDQLQQIKTRGPVMGCISPSPRDDMVAVYIAPHPAPDVAGLVKAAESALGEIEDIMQEAYNSAYPVCCGRSGSECCGSPDPEWEEADQRMMDRLAPHQKALMKALAAYRKQGGGE